MHDSAVEMLLMTLKEERAALRSGKFERLLDLEEQKSAQLQVLERKLPPHADLHKIRTKLSENQKLFSAAISGVKAARDRIEALHNVRSGLQTYDKSGAMATVPIRQTAVEKKA
jgi:hypothetical protein